MQSPVQWNPSIADTIGNQHFVPNSEVSGIFLVGVATFSELPLLYTGREGQAEASIMSNNTSLMSSC